MEIYLIRHGETKENEIGIVQGKGVDGDLNQRGEKQSSAFYTQYAEIFFNRIYCSSLKRSFQTVRPFIDKGIPWEATSNLDEISWGIHEGLMYNPQLIQNYKELIAQWAAGNLNARLPRGESAHELVARTDLFIESLKSKISKRILICSHGRTIRCLLCRMLGLQLTEMEKFKHHNTGLFLIKWDGKGFKLEKENDISHLPDELFPGD